jgi:hypothetical protein
MVENKQEKSFDAVVDIVEAQLNYIRVPAPKKIAKEKKCSG